MNEHYEMIYSPTMSGKLREAIKAYFRNTVTSPKWTWPRWLKHSTTTGAMHLALSVTGDLFAETTCKLNHEMIATLPEVHSRLQAMGVELDRLIQSVDETLKDARRRDEALRVVAITTCKLCSGGGLDTDGEASCPVCDGTGLVESGDAPKPSQPKDAPEPEETNDE